MLAIIERTLFDAQSIASRVHGGRKGPLYGAYAGKPKSPSYAERELESLLKQVSEPHFANICDFAGLHQDHVLRMIKQINERAKQKYARPQSAS